jgi:hypothetical protein
MPWDARIKKNVVVKALAARFVDSIVERIHEFSLLWNLGIACQTRFMLNNLDWGGGLAGGVAASLGPPASSGFSGIW